jgi:hypothetical protein
MLQDARENICDPGSHPITDQELISLARWGASLDIGKAGITHSTNENGGMVIAYNPTKEENIVAVLKELFKSQRTWRSDEAWNELESRLALDRSNNADKQAVGRSRKTLGITAGEPSVGLPKGVRQWTSAAIT